ncbi:MULTISPECIES: PHP domain-containing protein [Sporomusa]|uniref:PHP domain-containing protein n=1 Tax=Sporomusa TaxID=2375 RepID=UPI003158BA57
MLIDCHLHDSKYSCDSHMTLPEAVKRAKEIGLDAICMTNHDNNKLRNDIGDSAMIDGVLVIVGSEILTHEGDILVFGLQDLPDEKTSAEELLTLVRRNNGVAIAAHPFRNNNRGLGNNIRRLSGLLSAVEAFNGSTLDDHNLESYRLARELNLPIIGSSDAHKQDRVGRFATFFADTVRDHRDFVEAINHANYYPVMNKAGGFVLHPWKRLMQSGDLYGY